MEPKIVLEIVLEIVCIPVAVTAVTMYVVVVAIDTTARNVFGEVWRLGPL